MSNGEPNNENVDLDPIVAYLRKYTGQYDLEALKEQVLQGGHYDQATVERAVAKFRRQNAARDRPGEQESASRWPVWPQALSVLGLNCLLGWIVYKVSTRPGLDVYRLGASLLVFRAVVVGVVLGEAVGGLVLVFPRKSRRTGLALIFGLLLSAALAILAVAGFCIFIFVAMSKEGHH